MTATARCTLPKLGFPCSDHLCCLEVTQTVESLAVACSGGSRKRKPADNPAHGEPAPAVPSTGGNRQEQQQQQPPASHELLLPGLLPHMADRGHAAAAHGNGYTQAAAHAPAQVYVPRLQRSITLPPCPTAPSVTPAAGTDDVTPSGAPVALASRSLSHQIGGGTSRHNAAPRVSFQHTQWLLRPHSAEW